MTKYKTITEVWTVDDDGNLVERIQNMITDSYGDEAPVPEPKPDPIDPLPDVLTYMVSGASYINVREFPDVNSADKGDLVKGSLVDIETGSLVWDSNKIYLWGKIYGGDFDGYWVATKLLTLIEEPRLYSDGIDVSHNQNSGVIESENPDFVYIKMSQRHNWSDPEYLDFAEEAEMTGSLWGPYHFYEDVDPQLQAAWVIQNLNKKLDYDLPLAIDVEVAFSPVRLVLFLELLTNALGYKPVVYTRANFINSYNLTDDISDYPLWVASYDVEYPILPRQWAYYRFWQRTTTGNTLDKDYFYGSTDDLEQWLAFHLKDKYAVPKA